jgi:glycosyltransferase involved in cell wall biosynthesis
VRILLVYPYVPYPLTRGTFHRVFNLALELGQRHQVDLFCLDDAKSQAQRHVFETFAKRVHFQPFAHPPWAPLFPKRLFDAVPATIMHWSDPAAAAALTEFASGRSYDLLHFCDLVMWPYVAALPGHHLRIVDRSRVDLMFQTEELANLELGTKEKWLRRENLWKLRRYERKVAAQLTATVVCGTEDEIFLRKEVPSASRIKVLPNGVDERYFRQEDFLPTPDPDPTILFCGAMDYSPNVSGLGWYFAHCDDEVRRLAPNRRILIVGKSPVSRVQAYAALPGVTVTGEVPDVRPYYQRAWLQMVPLWIGGGTRLKIAESLAMGTPVVSTTIGAQGLALRHEVHLLLADTPGDFSKMLVRLLASAVLRKKLAAAGRQHILQNYTWSRLGSELSLYYEQLQNAL